MIKKHKVINKKYTEDKNFYSHFGIDFVAILRAAISNILATFNNQKIIGASTITQQVVKNLLLSNEVSLDRKIKEILLSIRVENILSKNNEADKKTSIKNIIGKVYDEPIFKPGGDKYMFIEFGNLMDLEINFTAQNLAKAIHDNKIKGIYEDSTEKEEDQKEISEDEE